MTAHLTRKEAAQLGLFTPPTKAPTKARRERWPYLTECWDCGELFTTEASESRHLTDTGHHRYQLVISSGPTRKVRP